MVSTYINAYLDVISLYSYCPDYDVEKLNVSLVKREKILGISAEDLRDNCDKVCDAIDLALFFLQMRCGIRNIGEINYDLILVVIAYLLLKPEYKDNPKTYRYLDAWYWIMIFSGFFNTDQTERAITCIKRLIELFETEDKNWIKGIEAQVFAAPYFSEKEFILLNKQDGTGIYPKEFLRDSICQFFMVETYYGLFETKKLINPFIDEDLEKHHLIP